MSRSKPSPPPGPSAECRASVGKTPASASRAPASPPLKQDSPPPHLRPETVGWWRTVVEEFELEQHHLRLLRLACEAWDRGQEAREALAEHGSIYADRFGQPRARPEVAIERDARISFARMLRELALDVDGPTDDDRPPRLKGGASRRPTESQLKEMAEIEEFERLYCR